MSAVGISTAPILFPGLADPVEVYLSVKLVTMKEKLVSNTIDLAGPDGNAYNLFAYAEGLCRQLGRSDQFDDLLDEMMSGDYNNVIRVFEKNFGDYVTLLNKPEEDDDDE